MRKALLAMSGLRGSVRPSLCGLAPMYAAAASRGCVQQLFAQCCHHCAFTYFHQAQPISGCAMVLVSLPFRLRVLLSEMCNPHAFWLHSDLVDTGLSSNSWVESNVCCSHHFNF